MRHLLAVLTSLRCATTRSIVAVLVVAVGLGLGAASVSSAGKKAQRPSAAGGAQAKVGREVVSLRTKSSKTFLRKDGQRVARVYGGAVHFKNAKGRWQNIDTQLRRSDGRLLNRTNGFSSSLPADIGRDSFRIRRGRWWVGFSVRGDRGEQAA